MTENKDALPLDWLKIAKLAGEHGVRYQTNARLEAFLAALSITPPVTTRDALVEIRDLLMERVFGNPARSSSHNARVKVESLIAALSAPNVAGEREALDLNSDLLPAARAAADAAMAQTADVFDINDSADAQRWMDARNGAWFALSTPQPESVEANVQLVSLADCPPGPFEFNGGLGFKTEYGAMRPVANHALPCFSVSRFPDAYCMESGEFFWGGTTTHEERAKLLVRPIDVAEVAQVVAKHGGGDVLL